MMRLFLLFLLIAFSSCEKIIEVEEEEVKPKLVLNAQFETDSLWSVTVSHSQSVLDDNEISNITNAAVTISDVNGNLITQLAHAGDGEYTSATFSPAAGSSYRIDATAPGYDPVYALSSAPSAIPFLGYDTSSVNYNGYEAKRCSISFVDPPGEGDKYIITAFSLYWYPVYDPFGVPYDTVTQYNFSNIISANIHVENSETENFQERLFLTDNLMQGTTEVDFIIPGYYSQNNSFGFILWHVSEEYYQFARTMDTYFQSVHDPFAQPVLIYSNVLNGRGIFAGFTRSMVAFFF